MTRPLALSLACAILLCGCRASIQRKVFLRPGLEVSTVAVYPFGFRWDEPAYRSFELSHRLVGAALATAGDRLLFFGPGEFKVFRAQDDNAWAATNVVSLLPAVEVRPVQAVVLRPWAERRIFSSQKELFDAQGKAVGSTTVLETTFVGHVEILHPSTRELVVEVISEAQVDPFAERADDEFDPAPDLTALMEKLTATAIDEILEQARPPAQAQTFPYSFAFNPKAALAYSEEGRPSFERKLASMDPVEAELLTQGRVRFANPGLPDAEAAKLAKLPGGLYVTEAPVGAKLEVGDLITAVEGQPALPATLQRTRFFAAPVQVKVRRASGELTERVLP